MCVEGSLASVEAPRRATSYPWPLLGFLESVPNIW